MRSVLKLSACISIVYTETVSMYMFIDLLTAACHLIFFLRTLDQTLFLAAQLLCYWMAFLVSCLIMVQNLMKISLLEIPPAQLYTSPKDFLIVSTKMTSGTMGKSLIKVTFKLRKIIF